MAIESSWILPLNMVIFQSYVINVYQRVIWLIDYETTKRYDDDI